MHLKALHNFLLIVLCTIGIGFASAPPAAAQALKITDGNGTAIGSDNGDKLITFGTATWTDYGTLGCRKQTVKIERTGGLSGAIKVSIEVVAGNDGGNSNILNEFKVHRTTSDDTSETFIVYYIPDQVTTNSETTKLARIKVSFTCGGQTAFVRFGPSFDGNKNGITPVLEGTDALPAASGTITLSSTAFDLNAIKTDNEWKTNGKLVRELTVTGTNVTGNITLSVSPQGHYGLTVTPTTLPSTGGKVTITYKPQTGNDVHTNPYPVLSVKADNATAQTVELRTTWDGSTHAEGVTAVPDIPAGTFDPDIYESKAFKGRNTVSLRWELKNPNNIELKSYSQSAINTEMDETTKAWMNEWNTAYDNYSAMKYSLYRDGKVIVSGLDITSYVDMNVPEGDHKYHVVAQYRNGRTASSEEKTVKVERDMAITNYVLEEVYNYPIVNEETWNNMGQPADCFKAFGTENGIHRESFLYKFNSNGTGDPKDPNKAKSLGAPGDGVRQGVFYNGKWYIALVTDRQAVETADTKANAIAIYGGMTDGEHGHILEIDAGEGVLNTTQVKSFQQLHTMTNQSLAVTADGRFYFRADKENNVDGTSVVGDRYLDPIQSFGFYKSQWAKNLRWDDVMGLKTEADKHNKATETVNGEVRPLDSYIAAQYYRTHYMAARGKLSSTGSDPIKLCFAQNYSHDAYIIDMQDGWGAEGGLPNGTWHKLSAPRQVVTHRDGQERIIDIEAGTENYIFPVEGEPNKYIHVMRSSGVFLVDVTDINNPIYTLISADLSEVRSASGMTFTLKNTMDGSTDLFYIHGTSLHSNNPGHFRIDMPQRTRDAQGKYTGDIHTADFSDLVPMASKLQDAIPGFEAGNSNGMWFGTEDATEDGIAVKYIYQYVPGVRFAKYKFYPVQAFPPARPTIDVVIRHDDPAKDNTPHMADDITHFDIAYSWRRPANFGSLQGATYNFQIAGYNAELLDPNGNTLDKRYVAAQADETDETVYGPFYYNQHKPAAGGKIDFSSYNPETASQAGLVDIHDGNYVINVTPVYVSVNDANRKYTGENGLAQDATDYTPEILNIRAKLFQAKGNANLYRVDIDFNRAPRHDGETSFANPGGKEYTFYKGDGEAANHKLAEPASRFKLEVSKDNGNTWQAIDNLRVFYDGKILINKNNSTEKAEIDRINANITEHQGEIHSGEHDGFIKHDYNFGGSFTSRSTRPGVKARAAAQPNTYGDKMYVQEAIAHLYGDVRTVDQNVLNAEKNNGAFQAVAYHMVDASKEDVSNIRNWKYRATALYADNQPYSSIKRSASVETVLGDPIATGVEDAIADAAEGVHIWPVPAESELHIAAGEAIESVSIYNISGSCVASFKGNGDTTMTVSVDNLASGVYFVKVNANAAKRLIKR